MTRNDEQALHDTMSKRRRGF